VVFCNQRSVEKTQKVAAGNSKNAISLIGFNEIFIWCNQKQLHFFRVIGARFSSVLFNRKLLFSAPAVHYELAAVAYLIGNEPHLFLKL